MRITGGQARGRVLASPRGLRIRPSSDRVREAIFNLLGQDLSGLTALDLFSGTGALGLEAISRGAEPVFFVDGAAAAVNLIRRNLSRCGFPDSGVVLRWDLRRGLPAELRRSAGGLDLVFLDPPYDSGLIPTLVRELLDRRLLAPGARIVAETSRREALAVSGDNLAAITTRDYGDTRVRLFQYEEDP